MAAAVLERNIAAVGQRLVVADTRISPSDAAAAIRRLVDDDPSHVIGDELDLAGVDALSDLEPKGPHPVADRRGGVDARGTVEDGEKTVARRIDLPTAESIELISDLTVVAPQQLPPPVVADTGGKLREPTMSLNNTDANTRSPASGSNHVRTPDQLMPRIGTSPIAQPSWPGGMSKTSLGPRSSVEPSSISIWSWPSVRTPV